MSYISVRGFDHYYEWITAEGAVPTGKPTMIFIHGWGGSSRYWQSTAQAITDQFDCLLYDMRGFGRSQLAASNPELAVLQLANAAKVATLGKGEDVAQSTSSELFENTAKLSYEMESYAEDLTALIDALKLSQVYVNAHSMGASVAVFFLNLCPDRVKRAILTCSGIFEYEEKAFTTFHKFGTYVVKFRPRWLYQLPLADRFFMARFLHRSLPRAISRAFLDDFLMADYEAAVGTVYTSVSKKAAETMPQEFARLSVPTLLIAGEHDIIIPAKLGKQAASISSQVKFTIIPNTAHFPMLEDAPTYLQCIRDFLA
ncbi:MAG: alpha/beta hydrolase [Scytolyngbya sp. HA4215-MV1]|nr:alpha/beta hydrolase [Scytolyngbya sp. HA4215-MV1]